MHLLTVKTMLMYGCMHVPINTLKRYFRRLEFMLPLQYILMSGNASNEGFVYTELRANVVFANNAYHFYMQVADHVIHLLTK